MRLNKNILIFVALFPFAAIIIAQFTSLYATIFLALSFIIGIFLNFLSLGTLRKPSRMTLLYFIFISYVSFLDYTRGEIFGCGYNFIYTLPMLYYLDQFNISEKTKNSLNKLFLIIIISSLFVIIIQQFFNATFLLSPRWLEFEYSDDFYTKRLPSIYSWVSFTAPVFTFPPLLGILINENINKKRISFTYLLIVLGLLFSVLSKVRAISLYVVIVSAQVFLHRGLKMSRYIRLGTITLIVLIFFYTLLLLFNVPIDDILFYRFLEGGRKFDESSAYARVLNFNFFINNVKNFWLIGAGNEFSVSLQQEMARKSNSMLIGLLDPFFRYGIVAMFLYLAIIISILRKFYNTTKLTANWGPFLGMVGFVMMNITMNAYHFFQVGIIFLFIYEKYYRELYLIKLKQQIPLKAVQ